jgi:hypothetical protein
VIVSDAVIVTVGTADVGATVVGATVVGATVVGATVVGATVVGATVVGATVVGATVVGATVVGATVVGDAVAVADFEVVGVAVVFAAGVVAFVPGVVAPVVGLTTGPTVALVVGGSSRALRIGGSPVTLPDCFVDWPLIAFGFELAWAAAGDSIGSAVGAGQSATLQAMNPLAELRGWDALVPYQQMIAIAPRTPVPITRFRTECGR